MAEWYDGSVQNEQENKRRSTDYVTVAEYWKDRYEKEKELNNRFNCLEENIENNIRDMIKPISDSQNTMLEKIGHLEGRVGTVETAKDQRFRKSLEHLITGRNLLLLVLGGGSIFTGLWSWLLNFFQ